MCTRVTRRICGTILPHLPPQSLHTCQCWGAHSSPLKLEGSPLARSGWTGHGIRADHRLLAPGLLFYEEYPGLQSTQLCSWKHQGACLWNRGLFQICLQTEISNAEEKPALSALDPGLLVVRPPAWHGILVGTSCGFHAMLTRHMTQNKFSGPANSE